MSGKSERSPSVGRVVGSQALGTQGLAFEEDGLHAVGTVPVDPSNNPDDRVLTVLMEIQGTLRAIQGQIQVAVGTDGEGLIDG